MLSSLDRSEHNPNPELLIRWVVVAGIVSYLLIFSYNSLARTRQFSADSMNYVDVARNIASGRGIVQSTLGYNQPFLFNADSQIPTPLVSQPPLYPILIALSSKLGLTCSDAALVIPAVAYGGILLLGYFLSRDLFGEPTALLALASLLMYAPLSYVSRFAWSESVGILFLFICLLFLVKARQFDKSHSSGIISLCAGLAAGLAFSTRYAMAPLFVVGPLLLAIEFPDNKTRLRVFLPYLLGASLPTLLVLYHNLASTGQIMPLALASDRPFQTNLQDAFFSTFGDYLWEGDAKTHYMQAALALSVGGFCVIALAIQRRTRDLLTVFVRNRRYLLVFWLFGYSILIVYQRTISHFDIITNRIMVPAGVVLIMLGIELVVAAIGPGMPRTRVLYGIVILTIIAACAREMKLTINQPVTNAARQVAQSDRLSWVAQHTTDHDLIVGDDTMDIPFYFERQAAVSVSPYPHTIHLTSPLLTDFTSHNCSRYQNIYLILRSPDSPNYDAQLYEFGQFITDIRLGDTANYPDILPIALLKDARVFQLSCRRVN